MLNISETTALYIQHKFIDEMKVLVLDAFSMMEAFQLNFYEDRYIDLISSDNTIGSDDIYTIFLSYIQEDIKQIIDAHAVTIAYDMDVKLSEMLEITHVLLLLANLEDYTFVSYRVNTEQPSRITFIDLVERYSLVPRFRAMEIISNVEDAFIETLRKVSEKALVEDTTPIDLKHRQYTNWFFKYIENSKCLALDLKEKGFETNLTIEELVNLLNFDLSEYVTKNSITSIPQVSLDILSLLIYTQDDYDKPVFKFKKNVHLFTTHNDLSDKLHNTIFAMVNDFSVFLEACRQQEKINAN